MNCNRTTIAIALSTTALIGCAANGGAASTDDWLAPSVVAHDDWETPNALTEHEQMYAAAAPPSAEIPIAIDRVFYPSAEMNEGDEVGGLSRDCDGTEHRWGRATIFMADRLATCGAHPEFISDREYCHVDGLYSECPFWLCDLGWADCE